MNILVIGSGGREHAIVKKLSQSNKSETVFVSPGNPGMTEFAELVDLKEFSYIKNFCNENNIGFVFVGPEQPLAEGLTDYLEKHKIAVVGPSKAAAQIESSKIFSKNLMKKYNIPTASYETFNQYNEALNYLENCKFPQVLKADGLAAGKGVIIVNDLNEAKDALKLMMLDSKFGDAGTNLVIEEFMVGWETSIFAFCDGENFVSTIFSQDHKNIYDGDKGPNTGGMGAYAPVKKAEEFRNVVNETIFAPTLEAMKKEGFPFKGVLFAGLMMTDEGPKVVEFNCRFGDPETEVILPLLETDLVDISQAIIAEKINEIDLTWKDSFAVTVVGASEGYPESYEKGKVIKIDESIKDNKNIQIYFAGVKSQENELLTNGGRVFMLTAESNSLKNTIDLAYENMSKISFEGMYHRKDIGKKGLI